MKIGLIGAGIQAACPSAHGAGPAPGSAVLTSAPRCLLAGQGAAGYCGVDLSTGRHEVEKPGIDNAEPPQPCDDAPGSEVSLGKLLKHRLIQFGVCQ